VAPDETIILALKKSIRNKSAALSVFYDGEIFIGVVELEMLIHSLSLHLDKLNFGLIEYEAFDINFLNHLSHEIRTPLNSLLGFIDIISHLSSEMSAVELKESATTINQSSKCFLTVMEDIINIAHLSCGKQILVVNDRVNLNELYSELMDHFRMMSPTEYSQFKVVHNQQPDRLLHVKTDKKKLIRILHQLIIAAIKSTSGNALEFGIKVLHDSNFIELFIQSKNDSCKLNLSERIIRPFDNVDYLNGKYTKFLGLGCNLVRYYSELLMGSCSVISNKMETRFVCTIPNICPDMDEN